MPKSEKPELVRFRAWPCNACSARANVFDFILGRHQASGAVPLGSTDENIEQWTIRERHWLLEWAGMCSHRGSEGWVSGWLRRIAEGSEHIVYAVPGRVKEVLKITKPGLYGDRYFIKAGRVHQARCTPTDYLSRLGLIDDTFGIIQSPVGIMADGQIVSKQRFVQGEPPTQEEADEFLLGVGLEPVKQSCWLWKRTDLGGEVEFWIGDARADNFVKTPHGIVPIDLRMWGVVVGEDWWHE